MGADTGARQDREMAAEFIIPPPRPPFLLKYIYIRAHARAHACLHVFPQIMGAKGRTVEIRNNL